MITPTTQPAETPVRAALRGARANLGPGLVLQAFAITLVLAYYGHAGTRAWFDRITVLREDLGVIFPMATTAVFGAIIPSLYLWALPETRRRQSLAKVAALAGFWLYKGAEVDLLYRSLAALAGADNRLGTILTKASIDQFIYCPLWAVPTCWAMYAWVEADLRWAPIWQDIRTAGWYRRSVLPVLISNFGVWLPAVSLIYALPTGLQLPMQNLVLCFYTLLLVTLERRRRHGGQD
ncbi:MAG: hypothetical protein ABII82_05290 [Verrucomicrobiota bacterium]